MAVTGTDSDLRDSAVNIGNPLIQNTPAPASYGAGAQQLLAADILGGIIVAAGSGGGGATAITLPTAANLAAAIRAINPQGVRPGDTVWCLIINGNSGAGALTITSPGASVTFDTNQNSASQVVAQNSSKEIACRFTNGTPSSEAYVVYS